MREVIQRLMATEEEAKTLVATAHQEAEAILQAARAKAAEIAERARAQAAMEAEQILLRAAEQARLQEQKLLAQADAAIESELRLDPRDQEWAVRTVVQCVCGVSKAVQEGDRGRPEGT